MMEGMRGLINDPALEHVDFVFAESPYRGPSSNLWIKDPPLGKNHPTTDPEWDEESTEYIDDLVHHEGPFYAILGYSQGAAFSIAYLAHAPPDTFQAAILFCGYLPTTHEGIMDRIDDASPFAIRSLFFMGLKDNVIPNVMTATAAARFSDSTTLASPTAGHHPPHTTDPTFDDVVAFISEGLPAAPPAPPSALPYVSC